MITIDIVACGGGAFYLFAHALLACYLCTAHEKNKNLVTGPFESWICCWTVLCFFSAVASVALFLEVREYEGASVHALGIFLGSASFWPALTILDIKYRNACTLSLLGLCMLATPCAWVAFFISGPTMTLLNLLMFMWTVTHHAIFDSCIWFAIYVEQRVLAGSRVCRNMRVLRQHVPQSNEAQGT